MNVRWQAVIPALLLAIVLCAISGLGGVLLSQDLKVPGQGILAQGTLSSLPTRVPSQIVAVLTPAK